MLRNSRAPQAIASPSVAPTASRAGRGATCSTLVCATRESGCMASVITGKNIFSPHVAAEVAGGRGQHQAGDPVGVSVPELLGDRAAHASSRRRSPSRCRARRARAATSSAQSAIRNRGDVDPAAVPALVEGDDAVGAGELAEHAEPARGRPCSRARAAARSSVRPASGPGRRRRRSGPAGERRPSGPRGRPRPPAASPPAGARPSPRPGARARGAEPVGRSGRSARWCRARAGRVVMRLLASGPSGRGRTRRPGGPGRGPGRGRRAR